VKRVPGRSCRPLGPTARIAVLPLLLLPVSLVLAVVALAQAQDDGESRTRQVSPILSKGAAVFSVACSVCHGATGMGLDEARKDFPPDHRRCYRCHRPSNPPTMALAQIEARQHDLFSIGEPPPLRGSGAFAAAASPAALRAYLAAAMPRSRPGSLSPEEYDALTAYLLYLNGRRFD
jgi:mono/diheme cytochrome c family protein